MKNSIFKYINSLGCNSTQNVSLEFYSTIKIGGIAPLMVKVNDLLSLQKLLKLLLNENLNWHIVGYGSNTLFPDDAPNMVIIKLGNPFDEITVKENHLSAGGNTSIPILVRKAIENNLGGIEFLGGIPGTVGGAVCANAGCKHQTISHFLKRVLIIDGYGEIKSLEKSEISFKERWSSFQDNYQVIYKIEFELPGEDNKILRARLKNYLIERKKKFPLSRPSLGSIFKKPGKGYAGKWIEKSRLKGFIYGNAKISGKHANWIINLGHAKAAEVKYLINLIQDRVYKNFGILLEPEIKIF